MPRPTVILALVFAVALNVASQSVPKRLLSVPARLELDRATTETKIGSTVTYTVTLRDATDRSVAASANLQLDVETPSSRKSLVLPAGQSSVNFTWQAVSPGVVHMTVRSGKLHPATGLVLVAPSAAPAGAVAPTVLLHHHDVPAGVANVPQANHHFGSGAAIGSHAVGAAAAPAGGGQSAVPTSAAAEPTPQQQAQRIQLFIEPLPVYGNAVDHIWKASVSVAAMGNQDSLVPVSADVPIHFNASSGHLSSSDIVLSAGQLSNFQNPVLLTTDRSGRSVVDAVSSLGPAGPVEVQYLQPPPTQIRLSLGTPILAGTGSSTATVQVCLLDESGVVTASDQDIQITLTAPGQLGSSAPTIHRDASCSDPIVWTSGPGPASIRAESSGLKSDTQSIMFPSFPWYFVWLAAVGGLVGALIFSIRSGDLFSVRWWSYTWRGLVLGSVLGAVFYLFARFGAIALPKDSPVDIQKIPAVSGVGSLLLGFLGGVYGRRLWKIDQDEPGPPASPKMPIAKQSEGASTNASD
jgi:hypothetical protein